MSERYETGCLSSISTSFENSMLEIGNFRPELHVAQQSRREKLRVPQSSAPSQTLEDFPIHSGQLPIDPGLNPDLIQNRNFRNCGVNYDTTILSSEMLNFSTNSYPLHHESGARRLGRLLDSEDVAFGHSSCSIPSNFKLFGKANDPRNTIYWKGSGSHQNRELTKYVNGSEGNACNQNPPLVGEIIAGTMKINSIDESTLFSRHGYNGYQDVQSSLANPSNEISNGQAGLKHYGNMRFNSPICRNTLEDVVTSSTTGNQGFDAGSLVHQNTRETGSLTNEGSELALLPAYGNASGLNNAAAWMHKSSTEGNHHWSGELCFSVNKNEGDLRCLPSDFRTQGLSLSLSSRPSSEMHSARFGERFGFENLQTGSRISNDPCPLDTKTHNKSNYLSTNSKLSMGNKSFDNSVRDTLGPSTYTHQNTGPLGPFTGYATILNGSKFLKPAQQLLGEICSVTGQKVFKSCEVPERSFGDVSISGETVNTGNEIGEKQGTSSVASTLNTSNEAYMEARATASDNTGIGSESFESHRPECQQRKAKLIYMQEEVCRRYKQYHLQMQMVVSSFESVAGLSAATPYTSLAIKTVAKHFRCLKNAISDQLQHVGKALGDDLSSPATIAGSSKGDTVPRLKFIDQSLRNHKSGGSSLGYLESQQHVWRPQRGLPERSVAILRAWLFEHFLHPYPTDNDKHMLATQTGLSRNQVSNWFINARVRVWKPMVEEIHMLETKGLAETDANHGRNDRKRTAEGGNLSNSNQPPDNVVTDSTSQKRLGCSRVEVMMDVETGQKDEELNQGKRLRAEFQMPASMEEGSLISVVPFRGSALEIGELGAVSLTLGLRHNAESVQQQLQQQEHHQLMRQFGGQMIHDFVG